MLFTDRKDLADKADQWMEEKHIAKTSLGVISYLDTMGWLKSDNKNDDLIKRQDVIDLVKNSYYNLDISIEDTWAIVADVEKLPSEQFQPEQLTCDGCKWEKERSRPLL